MDLGKAKPRGTRRLVYNSDPSNTTAHLSDPATQPKELRQVVRNYAIEGGVDTLVQELFAEGMTMFWRTDKCPYDIRYQHQRLVPMMNNGLMPVEVYIDECHKQGMEFLAGFRMNDRHGHHPEFFKRLCEQKPEWVLREYKPSWKGAPAESHEYGCSLNYAVDGVREWLLSIMTEVANRFDIDGIEFNFTRLAECFPKGEAAHSHSIMTDFISQVRAMLDEASSKRFSLMTNDHHGFQPHVKRVRKLILGVRVPQQLEGCRKMGLDIAAWIERDLIDYVAPSDFGFTDFNERYEDFVVLTRSHDCFVYPQVQPRMWLQEADYMMDPPKYRAAVQNFYAAGADGFSTQNFFFHWMPAFEIPGEDGPKFPEMYPAALNYLKELKNPENIEHSTDRKADRHYVFLPIWGDMQDGRGMSGIYEKEAITLTREENGRRGTFRFRVCENFPAAPTLPLSEEGSGLTFRPSGTSRGDALEVDVNGVKIPDERLTWTWYEDGSPPLCRIALSDPPFVFGDNELGISITKSAEGGERKVVVERLECQVGEAIE